MKYTSTREDKSLLNFRQVTLKGLAADGGLYVPKKWKESNISLADKSTTFNQTAFETIKHFVGKSLDEKFLKRIIKKSYESFREKEITTLKQLDNNNFVLELFHGPTLAFKDIALQFLGNTFDVFLKNEKKKLTIIGATSGDTGSAAIDAVKSNKSSDIFILHPYKRVSEFQRKQMTTVNSKNVFNIALKGTFDDCQNIIKKLFRDNELNKNLNLGSINSINWTRIMAQITYYIYAYNKIKSETGKANISFSVPTGNFGDAYAGYIAKEKFRIPIKKLIIATNKNNILDRFFRTGMYYKDKVFTTISPSMDIQIASNFERLLYDITNENGEKVSELMHDFKKKGVIKVEKKYFEKTKESFISFSVNERLTKKRIIKAYSKFNMVIDPHTAVGLQASNEYLKEYPKDIVVTLSTAHPSKFSKSINSILGFQPDLPQGYKNIFNLEEKYKVIDNSYNLVKDFILKNATNI